MKRKFTQISVMPESESFNASIIALADDGTAWRRSFNEIADTREGGEKFLHRQWDQLPSLPDCNYMRMEFSAENELAIDELVGAYGDTPEHVVLNAISILYAIHKLAPSSKNILASGKVIAIPGLNHEA